MACEGAQGLGLPGAALRPAPGQDGLKGPVSNASKFRSMVFECVHARVPNSELESFACLSSDGIGAVCQLCLTPWGAEYAN
jgi:hypothetical protein